MTANHSARLVRLALAAAITGSSSTTALAKVEAGRAELAPTECTSETVDRAGGPNALRAVIEACKASTHVALAALTKLNSTAMPAPAERWQQPTPPSAEQPVETVTLQANLYFATGETYPTDEGMKTLASLVKQLNTTGAAIDGVVILGTVDAAEAATPIARDIARGRAEAVRAYLLAAGLQPSLVRVALRLKPDRSEKPSAGGLERAAGIAIVARRAVVAPGR